MRSVAGVQIHRRRQHFPARKRHDERGRTRERAWCERHVDASFEPIARIGGQSRRAACRARAWRVERANLQEDVGRGCGDFRGATAHHPGEPDRGDRIRDDGHFRGERSLHTIERHESFAGLCRANHERLLGHLWLRIYRRQIVRVRGLSELVQHVVRHVDDVVDRTRTDRSQPVDEPNRTRAHRHAANDDAHEARRERRVFEMQYDATGIARATKPLGCRHGVHGDVELRQLQRASSDRGDLARQSEMREQVWSVRQNVDHEPRIADGHRLEKGRSGRHVEIELEDAILILTE